MLEFHYQAELVYQHANYYLMVSRAMAIITYTWCVVYRLLHTKIKKLLMRLCSWGFMYNLEIEFLIFTFRTIVDLTTQV